MIEQHTVLQSHKLNYDSMIVVLLKTLYRNARAKDKD